MGIFIEQEGYQYIYAGENLAVDFSESSEVIEAWFDSPSHRENLLSHNYSEIGFAVINGELKGRKNHTNSTDVWYSIRK